MNKLLTVEVMGDKPQKITLHVILGSNVPPILGITTTQDVHNNGGVKQKVH